MNPPEQSAACLRDPFGGLLPFLRVLVSLVGSHRTATTPRDLSISRLGAWVAHSGPVCSMKLTSPQPASVEWASLRAQALPGKPQKTTANEQKTLWEDDGVLDDRE